MVRGIIFKRIALCMLVGMAFGVVISEVSYALVASGESRLPEVVAIDIPAGTAARLALGQSDPSIPTSLTFVAGDTLTVRNEDTVVHEVGPLFIPPGASASMKLDSSVSSSVSCSFVPSKYLGLKVQAPVTLMTRIVGIFETGINMGFLITVYSLFAIPMKPKSAPA